MTEKRLKELTAGLSLRSLHSAGLQPHEPPNRRWPYERPRTESYATEPCLPLAGSNATFTGDHVGATSDFFGGTHQSSFADFFSGTHRGSSGGELGGMHMGNTADEFGGSHIGNTTGEYGGSHIAITVTGL